VLTLLTLLSLQLPPLCRCKKPDAEDELASTICSRCHLSASPFWDSIEKFDIQGSVRHSEDPLFAEFNHLIRKNCPTQEQINHYLRSVNRIEGHQIPEAAAPSASAGSSADDLSTVLCSHNKDVALHNHNILVRLFRHNIIKVHMGIHVNKQLISLQDTPAPVHDFLRKPIASIAFLKWQLVRLSYLHPIATLPATVKQVWLFTYTILMDLLINCLLRLMAQASW